MKIFFIIPGAAYGKKGNPERRAIAIPSSFFTQLAIKTMSYATYWVSPAVNTPPIPLPLVAELSSWHSL